MCQIHTLHLEDMLVYRYDGVLSVRGVDVVLKPLTGKCSALPPVCMLYTHSYTLAGTLQHYSFA